MIQNPISVEDATSDTAPLLDQSKFSIPSSSDHPILSSNDDSFLHLTSPSHPYEPPITSGNSGQTQSDLAEENAFSSGVSISVQPLSQRVRTTESPAATGKHSSFVTIFSIWNTMMGTSLLAMPWALQQAGFALGIILILAIGGLCLYTAYRVVQSPTGLTLDVDSAAADLPDICRYFWGSFGTAFATSFSIIVILGTCIVYWVIMSNFLFHTGSLIHEAIQPNSTIIPFIANGTFKCDIYCPYEYSLKEELEAVNNYFLEFTTEVTNSGFLAFDNLWTLQGTVPICLAFLVLPLLNFKSPTFFTKFNVLGTISVMYLLIFVGSKALECGIHLNFSDVSSENFAKLFNWNFPALTGTLALSYFIHNAVLTILRNQANPANNVRDLTLGYCLAATCYIFVATMFFSAFPIRRSCISDNLLNNFGSGDLMSVIARVFILFQMMTVLPLLMYLIRVQFFFAVLGKFYPGIGYVILLNICALGLFVFIAIVYPHIGSILRFVGSFSGLIYVFTLPCAIHLKRLETQGRLRKVDIVVHGSVIMLGALNFVSQFLLF